MPQKWLIWYTCKNEVGQAGNYFDMTAECVDESRKSAASFKLQAASQIHFLLEA